MEFEWDEAKANLNLRKHGIDFADAARIFDDRGASHVLDETMDYGEARFKAIGMIGSAAIVVVYAERGSRIRIISARKATKLEERNHLKERWGG